jgi:hypothetical protein
MPLTIDEKAPHSYIQIIFTRLNPVTGVWLKFFLKLIYSINTATTWILV